MWALGWASFNPFVAAESRCEAALSKNQNFDGRWRTVRWSTWSTSRVKGSMPVVGSQRPTTWARCTRRRRICQLARREYYSDSDPISRCAGRRQAGSLALAGLGTGFLGR